MILKKIKMFQKNNLKYKNEPSLFYINSVGKRFFKKELLYKNYIGMILRNY